LNDTELTVDIIVCQFDFVLFFMPSSMGKRVLPVPSAKSSRCLSKHFYVTRLLV